MAADRTTTPPDPPPPPPPAPDTLRPTPEFQRKLDEFSSRKEAGQASGELANPGSRPTDKGLEPTADIQKFLDDFRARKEASQASGELVAFPKPEQARPEREADAGPGPEVSRPPGAEDSPREPPRSYESSADLAGPADAPGSGERAGPPNQGNRPDDLSQDGEDTPTVENSTGAEESADPEPGTDVPTEQPAPDTPRTEEDRADGSASSRDTATDGGSPGGGGPPLDPPGGGGGPPDGPPGGPAPDQPGGAAPDDPHDLLERVRDAVGPIRERVGQAAALTAATAIAWASLWNVSNAIELPGMNDRSAGGESENQPALSIPAETAAESSTEPVNDEEPNASPEHPDEVGPARGDADDPPSDGMLVADALARSMEKPVEELGEAAWKRRGDEQDQDAARRMAEAVQDRGEQRPDPGSASAVNRTGGGDDSDRSGRMFSDGPEYPPGDGMLGRYTEANTLQVGDRIDRFGDANGRWAAPEGTSEPDRALHPGHAAEVSRYEVVRPLPPEVRQGVTATYYATGDGGGLQYLFPSSIQGYVDGGYLRRIDD